MRVEIINHFLKTTTTLFKTITFVRPEPANAHLKQFFLLPFLAFCIILLVFTLSFLCLAGERVTIATLKWEPYIGPDLKNDGYVGELIKNAFKIKGYNPKLVYHPWKRTVVMARSGYYVAYGPEYFSEDIKKDFLFSRPFPGGPLGFFKLKRTQITSTALQDLKPYKIGVVRGYVNTAEFDSAAYLNKEEVTDDEMNLRKLVAGRVDLVVCDKYVGDFIIRRQFKERADEIEFMLPPLEKNKALYLCVSKKIPNASKIIEAFNSGVEKLLEKESFEEMTKRNNLTGNNDQ